MKEKICIYSTLEYISENITIKNVSLKQALSGEFFSQAKQRVFSPGCLQVCCAHCSEFYFCLRIAELIGQISENI